MRAITSQSNGEVNSNFNLVLLLLLLYIKLEDTLIVICCKRSRSSWYTYKLEKKKVFYTFFLYFVYIIIKWDVHPNPNPGNRINACEDAITVIVETCYDLRGVNFSWKIHSVVENINRITLCNILYI